MAIPATESLPVNYLRYCFELAFIVLVGFQGLFVFVMYGVRLKSVRLTWKKWFFILIGDQDKAVSIELSSREIYQRGSTKHRFPNVAHDMPVMGKFDSFPTSSTNVELKCYTTKSLSVPSSVVGNLTPSQIRSHSQLDSPIPEETNGAYLSASFSKESPIPNHAESSGIYSTDHSNSSPDYSKEVHSLSSEPSVDLSALAADNDDPIEGEDSSPDMRKEDLSITSGNIGKNNDLSAHFKDGKEAFGYQDSTDHF